MRAACGVPSRGSKFLRIFEGEINQKSWTPSKWRTFEEIKKRKPMTLHGRVLEDSKPKTVHSCTEHKQRNENVSDLLGFARTSPKKDVIFYCRWVFCTYLWCKNGEQTNKGLEMYAKNCWVYCLSSKMQNASMSAIEDGKMKSTRSRLIGRPFRVWFKDFWKLFQICLFESH